MDKFFRGVSSMSKQVEIGDFKNINFEKLISSMKF